ncbi:peptidoglycan-binding domain-containing protein [Streptomyces sp. NPDC006332]|uniref:peptidoglycan-binding domain-containing protein n=1 Tax=Streptomyces sp. NPDC006332 TaxID=3155456 RepID=UPI0033BCC987
MPTPPDQGSPQDREPLEPIRVLRPRRTDALAELIREYREQNGIYDREQPGPQDREQPGAPHREQRGADDRERNRVYESVALVTTPPHAEEETQELPPVAPVRRPAARGARRDRPRHLRRSAVVGAVAAAAVIGFGCAFLLPGRSDTSAAPPPAPSAPTSVPTSAAPAAPTSAAPTPTAPSGAIDPDGAGTLREGADGPEVTDLQQRLLRIPDVYTDGSTSGRYDATLTEAVARFQLWYGIRGDETGVYGDDTRRDLESRT